MATADAALQSLVNRLTNWQRNQWARAAYPQDMPFLSALLKRKHGAHPKARKRRSVKSTTPPDYQSGHAIGTSRPADVVRGRSAAR